MNAKSRAMESKSRVMITQVQDQEDSKSSAMKTQKSRAMRTKSRAMKM